MLSCWGRRLFPAGKGTAFAGLCLDDARLQDKAKVVDFHHVRAWRHTPLVINIIGILQCVRPVLHTEAIAFSGDSHRSYRYKHHRPAPRESCSSSRRVP